MRKCPVPVTSGQTLPSHSLLANRPGHLRQIEHRPPGTASRHDDRRVLQPEVSACDLSSGVSCPTQNLHDLDLEGLFERPSGHLLEFATPVGLNVLLDLHLRLGHGVVYLALCLVRNVLVVDASCEPADHYRAYRELGGFVNELPRLVGTVVPGHLVQDLALECAHGLLVDRADDQLAVPYDDVRVVLALLLLARIALLAYGRLEGHVQVGRQNHSEELLPSPILDIALHLRLGQIGDTNLFEYLQGLLPRELRVLVC